MTETAGMMKPFNITGCGCTGYEADVHSRCSFSTVTCAQQSIGPDLRTSIEPLPARLSARGAMTTYAAIIGGSPVTQ